MVIKNNKNYIPRSKWTIGQKAADKLTTFAGSWTFISLFAAFLIAWMVLNTSWLVFGEAWDEKPFILLNLILSCLAAVQAPVILMSQNRQAQRDRIKAEFDYRINKKAEREIQQVKRQLDRIENKIK